jgi:hypothetical protein
VTSVSPRAFHGESNHRLHAIVALVEVESDDFGVAVDAERQLREIVLADRKSIETFRELVDQHDIV